jgi:hypothetical protein
MDKNEKLLRTMAMLGMMYKDTLCPSCGLRGEPTTCPKCGRQVCSTCISVQKDMCINCDEVVGLKPLDEDVSDT